MNRGRGEHGGSLSEVLISLLFVGVVAGTMQQFGTIMRHGARVHEIAADAQEDVWAGLEFIERDLRGARYSPAGVLTNGLRRAKRDSVQVASDLDGDGDTDDANEVIAYGVNAGNRTLTRALGGASPQPVINHVADDGLEFAYFDADGNPLDPTTTGLSATDRARVRRIDVRLSVTRSRTDPSFRDPISSTGTTTVFLRNG